MTDPRYQRVDDNDPKRCQAVGKNGQCHIIAVEDCQYCVMHGGSKALAGRAEKQKNIYRLGKYQTRVNEIANHGEVKSLREEIGVTRMMLEEIVTRCGDSNELILYSSKISGLVMNIEKLVVSCNRLEASVGVLIDKQDVIELANQFVAIIGRYVNDADAIEGIADEIVGAILNAKKSNGAHG